MSVNDVRFKPAPATPPFEGHTPVANGRFAGLSHLLAGSGEGLLPEPDRTHAPQSAVNGEYSKPVLTDEHTEVKAAAELALAKTVLGDLSDDELSVVAKGGLAEVRPDLDAIPMLGEWAARQANMSLGYIAGAEQPGRHHAAE